MLSICSLDRQKYKNASKTKCKKSERVGKQAVVDSWHLAHSFVNTVWPNRYAFLYCDTITLNEDIYDECNSSCNSFVSCPKCSRVQEVPPKSSQCICVAYVAHCLVFSFNTAECLVFQYSRLRFLSKVFMATVGTQNKKIANAAVTPTVYLHGHSIVTC